MSKSVPALQPVEQLGRVLKSFDRRHRIDAVFFDWLEMAACAVSNAVDRAQYDEREAAYLAIVAKYDRHEIEMMCEMTAHLKLALMRDDAPLHTLMARLELGSKAMQNRLGQFYTPYEVSLLMARMTLAPIEKLREQIARRGFVTMMEPACGAGGMVLAFAAAFAEAGFDPTTQLHVAAVDIDRSAVHMTFLSAALRGLAAAVFETNSLSNGPVRSHWLTPRHVTDRWDLRLKGEVAPIRGVAKWRLHQQI
jgi:hypothetical protein